MDAVLRAASVYVVVFLIMRVSGKRTFAQVTPFDFVLLLIIGEATQQGLLGDDFSVTNAILVVSTLVAIDIAVSLVQARSKPLSKVVEGTPIVLVEHGRLLEERMMKARVDEMDIMDQARQVQGLERLNQVKYAVLSAAVPSRLSRRPAADHRLSHPLSSMPLPRRRDDVVEVVSGSPSQHVPRAPG